MRGRGAIPCLLFAVVLPAQVVPRQLAGRVVDERGEPLAGVAVCLIDGQARPFVTADAVLAPLTTTAADGTYAALLPDAVDGRDDRLLFVAKGRVHVSSPLHPHDGWPVALPRAHTLAGRVLDAEGKPVANVRVEAREWLRVARYRAESARLPWLPEPRTAVRTDAGGRFVMPGTVQSGILLVAGDGAAKLGPVALGDRLELVLPTVPHDATRDRRIDMRSSGRTEPLPVTVRAVDAAGQPFLSFRCAAMRCRDTTAESALWRQFASSSIDSTNGMARPLVKEMVAGTRLTLLASAPRMAAMRMQLDPDASEATIRFAPEATLQGTVADPDGRPIAGARLWVCRGLDDATVRATWADGSKVDTFDPIWGHAQSDADGRFTVHRVAAGKQHLVCAANGFLAPMPLPIEPAEGAAITDLHIALARQRGIMGTTRLARVPPLGASIRFDSAERNAAGRWRNLEDAGDYSRSAQIAADGTFWLPRVPPGKYTAQLVLPRALQQGAPDLVDLEAVTIADDTEHLALDARAHLPAHVHGTVRGTVPTGRMLVGASLARTNQTLNYGFAFFECALATVAPDGSFAVATPPGRCTLFVLDLWTGMLLVREPPREVAAGDELSVDLQVVAGACDVQLRGLDPTWVSWLEMLVPPESWPSGIDRMTISKHEYTKRIGCVLEPGTSTARLYLPPMAAELWLVANEQGRLDGARGEASIDVVAGETCPATIEFRR